MSSAMRARRDGRIHLRYIIVLLDRIFSHVEQAASCSSPVGLGVSSAAEGEVYSLDEELGR
jgi:hypothetical protein